MDGNRGTGTIKGNAADEESENSTSGSSRSFQPGENVQQQEDQSEIDEQKKQRALFLEKTQAVDDLLKREMMQLSLKDRNDIQEEIHGVKCLSPIETPRLLEQSLLQLDAQLDMIARVPASIPNISTHPLLLARNLGNKSFVNSPEFKLRFLRCEFFNVRLAAIRLCEYLYRIHSLFGAFCLQRELDLYKDFTKEELRYFRKGYFQFLPFRDRSGRRILIVFPHEDIDTLPLELTAKFIVYFATAGTNDVETQRKGLVVVVWFNTTHKIKYNIQLPMNQSGLQNYGKWGCVRVSALHVCTPDTPAFRFRRSILALRFNQNQRSRLKLHVGESVELRYSLQGFGIPTEHIPLTWTGTIKTGYLKSWMKLRKAFEDDNEARRKYMSQSQLEVQAFQSPNVIARGYISIMSGVVECPNSSDVAFRQGTSLTYHPGNVWFRSLIEASVLRLREALPGRSEPSGGHDIGGEPQSIHISSVVSEIFGKVIHQNNGRVLVWTSNHNGKKYGCWCIITNKNQIYSKIDYAVREHIRVVSTSGGGTATQTVAVSRAENQKANLQTSESSTSIFRQESPSQSCTEAASNILCGATDTEAPSMPNKRAKLSNTNDDASEDESTCNQLFCKGPNRK